jgi:hypothetical protein
MHALITGRITQPTGKRSDELTIRSTYTVEWHEIRGSMKYALIQVDRNKPLARRPVLGFLERHGDDGLQRVETGLGCQFSDTP